jgi:DNA polymerase-3 subunit epsilon
MEDCTPLYEVTFVVLDLETTGCSAASCEITEVGALKFCGGERIGTFQTLVEPGVPIPDFIASLTGITDDMVWRAPRIDAVLPSLLEFIRGAVIVGHNVRFDMSFLRASAERHGYEMTNATLDTWGLARRLLIDEVEDNRLSTLARYFRTEVEPCHRAWDDAAATSELLHALLERLGTMGVLTLDALFAFAASRKKRGRVA